MRMYRIEIDFEDEEGTVQVMIVAEKDLKKYSILSSAVYVGELAPDYKLNYKFKTKPGEDNVTEL